MVATPADFDPGAPYLVVGAHLDTIAVAPGAEDNASGIAVLLETARRARAVELPQVVFVAFGGEEPRGPGDLHHFGSKHYVAGLGVAERRHLRGMVALDRVGVGPPLTVGWVAGTTPRVRDALLRTADASSASAPPSRRTPAATTSPSPTRGCRRRGSAARRTPPTTPRRTCRPSSTRRSCSRTGGRALGLAHAPSPLNLQKFANIRPAAAYGTTRGAWSGPIR